MEEIWKDIEGYENLYQVSNQGRIKRKDTFVNHNKGGFRLWKGRILKQNTVYGYKQVILHKNGDAKCFRVHRLVAKAFIPNPDNLPEVNHKDCNRSNNFIENLEWCTSEYNINYSDCIQKRVESFKNNQNNSTVVLQFSLNGEFIKEWRSITDIENQNGWHRSCIHRCCKGERKSAYGFIWCYR